MKKAIFFGFFCFVIFVFYGLNALKTPAKESRIYPQKEQEEIYKPAFEVEVVVTNVDVVVTDKKGNRVTGLKPDNFEIIEDGYLQKLTNFFEVKGLDVYSSVV